MSQGGSKKGNTMRTSEIYLNIECDKAAKAFDMDAHFLKSLTSHIAKKKTVTEREEAITFLLSKFIEAQNCQTPSQ
jgi:hypothetical protein